MPVLPQKIARSFLFVPGDRPERFAKAQASGADAIILDLEDAVGGSKKAEARLAILAWLPAHFADNLWIRINASSSLDHVDDVHFLRQLSGALEQTQVSPCGALRVMLPKVESLSSVDTLEQQVEHRTGLQLIAQIESALGLDQMRNFGESKSVHRLAFGSIDYGLDLGLSFEDDQALLHARSQIVWTTRLLGLPAAIDTVTANLKDPTIIEHDAQQAKRLGFGGKLCIHPSQVSAVNAAFYPSEKEIAWAQQVIEASAAAGDGAVSLGGQMIDRPVLLRAQGILEQLR
jgi:citrate lyase subunit beta / citryl-CoA lyase